MHDNAKRHWIGALGATLVLAAWAGAGESDPASSVTIIRVPDGGLQPQVAVDDGGTAHLIYYRGDPHAGDIFYVTLAPDSHSTFSQPPVRVNSQEGSAVAIGTIRGPHLALGRAGRAHVAWIGSKQARPTAPSNETPLLYTRLNDERTGFEPQRNVIQQRPGLDAGASVAADNTGNVYVTWHAPGDEGEGEQYRRIWVARSSDDGKSFAAEVPASTLPTGACVCCAMRGFADRKGNLYILYRSANRVVNRDTYLLTSDDHGASFRAKKVHAWKVGQCMMSAAALANGPSGTLAAWETQKQVYYAPIDPTTFEVAPRIAAPGKGPNRKHPVVAANRRGDVLLAWSEGTGWGKGGAVVWQVFDKDGSALAGGAGRAEGLPAWSVVAVLARPDDTFAILY